MLKSFIAIGLASLLISPVSAAPSSKSIINKMIKAHGGLSKWKKAPTVSFKDEWFEGGTKEAGGSIVTVEQSQRRSYLDFPTGTKVSWDGEKAWHVGEPISMPPRFASLLSYYFACLPWLTKDPGVILSEASTAKLPNDETEYITIKMTFGENVGDTPDDYYLLYINPETYELKANEYIVTYKALLPEGATHTPPNTLIYDTYEEVDGLKVPTHFTIYRQDQSVYFTAKFSEWSFSKEFDQSRMIMPKEAVIDNSNAL